MHSDDPQPKALTGLPTSLTTFLLLVVAFLPLGLFAVVETVNQASDAQNRQDAEAGLLAEVGAGHVARTIARAEDDLRNAIEHLADAPNDAEHCAEILGRTFGPDHRVAGVVIVTDGDRNLCMAGDAVPTASMPFPDPGTVAMSSRAGEPLVLIGYTGQDGLLSGMAMLNRQSMALLPQATLLDRNYEIALRNGDAISIIRPWSATVNDDQIIRAERAIGETELVLVASYETEPLGPSELFSIARPIAMWLLAALFGLAAITFLLIRPLRKLQQAVIDHADGSTKFTAPKLRASATEIRQLASAFETAFDTLQSHEEQLAAGLEEQTRLTREVHHRVKNNLQVIASLLNLHARAAKSDDSAAAYASIQRRVDALAIVQRNLFAELDKEAGLPFRPVVAELASGLQQSAPADVRIAISLDIDPIRVSQDIAAPAAFLITELVELAMLCGERVEIAISVTALADRCARLSIRSAALAAASAREEFPRYRRVLTGMARQLQASLDEEETGTMFTIVMPTLNSL